MEDATFSREIWKTSQRQIGADSEQLDNPVDRATSHDAAEKCGSADEKLGKFEYDKKAKVVDGVGWDDFTENLAIHVQLEEDSERDAVMGESCEVNGRHD